MAVDEEDDELDEMTMMGSHSARTLMIFNHVAALARDFWAVWWRFAVTERYGTIGLFGRARDRRAFNAPTRALRT